MNTWMLVSFQSFKLYLSSKQRRVWTVSGVAAWLWTLWSRGQWMTHKGWVASVCLGDFTLFRQALQECPTIRPIGSGSTVLPGRDWLVWRPAVWKHCFCSLLSRRSCLQLSPVALLPHGADTVTHSIRLTPRWAASPLKQLFLATQWEPVRKRRPTFLQTAMTQRWDMLHLWTNPVSQPSYWCERMNRLLTLSLHDDLCDTHSHGCHNLHDITT